LRPGAIGRIRFVRACAGRFIDVNRLIRTRGHNDVAAAIVGWRFLITNRFIVMEQGFNRWLIIGG
jgi:hypothetical protein